MMSADNFNNGVVQLIRIESAFLSKILNSTPYKSVIELGCDKAQNGAVADIFGARYIGIDVRKSVVDLLNYCKLPTDSIYIHGNMDDLSTILPSDLVSSSTLCLLPFNLIGNTATPDRFFKECAQVGFDIALSSWQKSPVASAWRKNYYERCGLSDLREIERDISSTFSCDGFCSHAYSEHFMISEAASAGFQHISSFRNDIAQMLHLRCSTR